MLKDFPEAVLLLKKHIEVFSKITACDWELLVPHLEMRSLKKNEFFIREGKRASDIGFVLEGMLRQYYTKDGEEKTNIFLF